MERRASRGGTRVSGVLARAAAVFIAEQLESRVLLAGTGLTGEYFNSQTQTGYVFNETDAQINFNWGATSPGHGISSSNFSARWQGTIDVATTGTYTFYINGNGGEKLWINGDEIINNWTSHSTQDASATITLNANTQYSFEQDYFSATSSAATALTYLTPGATTAVAVPTSVLYPLTTGPGAYTPTAPNTNPGTPSTSGVPAGWSYEDIGNPSMSGTTTYNSSTSVFTVSGGGTLFGPVNDQFQYAYTAITGDFTFVTQLTSMTNPNGGAMAGAMVRTGLTASVPEFFVGEQPSTVLWSTRRQLAGQSENTSNSGSQQVANPYIKLVRGGNTIDAYYSTDDVNWTFYFGQQITNLPSTVYVGFAVAARTNSATCTATFANTSITAASGNNLTSFVANTFGGGAYHVQNSADTAYVDPATGQVFVNAIDENYSLAIYNTDGTFAAFGNSSHFLAGTAVYADANYVFMADQNGSLGAASRDVSGLQRYDRYGISIGSPILGNDIITGIIETGGCLYVASNNLIYQFNASTLNFTGTMWEVDRAANMAADAGGNLWIIQNAGSGAAAQVTEFTSAGAATGTTLTFPTASYSGYTVVPQGIAFNPSNGEIYVTDISALQDIHIFNTGGSHVGDFGYAMGIYGTGGGTVAGADAPLKFEFPMGVGFDSAGDVYVVDGYPFNNAPGYVRMGTSIRKFTSGGVELWSDNNNGYVGVTAADPSSPNNIYDLYWELSANYSALPGDDSSTIATLVDPFAYPTDPRLIPSGMATYPTVSAEFTRTSPIIRTIDGAKILFDFDSQGNAINIYRFVPGADYTVFCGEIGLYNTISQGYIWIDANGDGIKQSSEESFNASDDIGQSFGQYVDSNGNIWIADRSHKKIWEFKVGSSLNSIGAPVYSFSNSTTWAAPTSFTEFMKAEYNAATNTMILGGYTSANPDPTGTPFWGQAGSTLMAYTNWSTKGTSQSPAWTSVFPNNLTVNPVKAFDIAGNYIFAISFLGQTGIEVFNETTGAYVTTLMPSPYADADYADVDFLNPVSATELPSGQYVIYAENDGEGNSALYEWTPGVSYPQAGWTDEDVDAPGGAGSATWNVVNQTWTVSGAGFGMGASSGTADQINLDNTVLTGDGVISADLTNFTDSFSASGAAMLVMRADTTPGAVEAAIGQTPGGQVVFYYRTTTGGAIQSYTMSNSALGYLKLVRSGFGFSGYFSSNGMTWTQVGPTAVIASMPQTVQVGMAVDSNSDPNVASATFSKVVISPNLTSGDVDVPAQAGSSAWDNYKRTYQVVGGGTGISGTVDQFQFVSLQNYGDGGVTALLQSISSASAQAGLMYRNSLSANDAYIALLVGPGGITLQWRSAAGGATSSTSISGVGPIWLKITRSGYSFSEFISADGINWAQVGSAETLTGVGTNAFRGLAVSSDNAGATATAVFGNVSTSSTSSTFAIQSGGALDVYLSGAGAVSISPGSGGVINASQNGTVLSFTGITGITVSDNASGDAVNFGGAIAAPVTFMNMANSTVNVNSGAVTFAAGGTIGLGTLAIASGASAKMAATTTNTPVILSLTNLSIGATGFFDVTNNEILINYGTGIDPINSIAEWVASGHTGGAWNGYGIISSMAATNPNYAVGYADVADPGNPAGLYNGQLKVLYTLLGDANLDGKVNGTDFTLMSSYFNQAVTNGWDKGDFDYSGAVNGTDFLLQSSNFNQASQIAAVAVTQAAVTQTVSTPAAPVVTDIASVKVEHLAVKTKRRG